MGKNVVGSGVCPLAVHFRLKCGDVEDVVARIKSLKSEIRVGGSLYADYPESLFRAIRSFDEIDSDYFYEEGARSSIVIALKVIKSFCADSVDCAIAYTAGMRNGRATASIEKSLSTNCIRPIFDYLPEGKGDSQIDVVVEDLYAHETARMYQASRTSFKYKFNLEKIEKQLGSNIDILLLNRAATGAKKAALELCNRSNTLISYRIHNFSRHVGVAENADMLGIANYIFITDPAKDPAIIRDLKRYYDVSSLDELAHSILEINDVRRMIVIPPSEECENLRFYCSDFGRCVEVRCPDAPRVKTAWLNGACIGLVLKNWLGGREVPFMLDGYFPKTYSDFEKYADWAVQLAYAKAQNVNFAVNGSWIVK